MEAIQLTEGEKVYLKMVLVGRKLHKDELGRYDIFNNHEENEVMESIYNKIK